MVGVHDACIDIKYVFRHNKGKTQDRGTKNGMGGNKSDSLNDKKISYDNE